MEIFDKLISNSQPTPVSCERSLKHGLDDRLGTRIKRLTGNQPPKLVGTPPKLEKAWRPEEARPTP